MATKVGNANVALRLCGVKTIASFTADSTEAQVIRDFYEETLDFALSLTSWTFAKAASGQLAKLAGGDTDDGYERYQRPPAARIVKRVYTSYDTEIPFRTDGDEIVTLIDVDSTSGVHIDYIEVTDEGLWTGAFTRAFQLLLASDVCEPLTENSSKAERLRAQALGASPETIGGFMSTAMMIDSRQGGQKRLFRTEEMSMLTSRGFGRGWNSGPTST